MAPVGTLSRKNAVVVADVLGDQAGAYVASALLCQALSEVGFATTCFARFVKWGERPRSLSYEVRGPWLRHGARWNLPGRLVAIQARRFIAKRQPSVAFCVGLTALAGHLLATDVAARIIVWELTNALPHGKFVDRRAAELLTRSRALAVPSATIEHKARSTYHYNGIVVRLPFWVEDTGQTFSAAPQRYDFDFIYLGRREREKGLHELIEATALVAEQSPNVRVMIAGAGGGNEFHARVEQLCLGNNVKFADFASRSAALAVLAKSRFLVLPSYEEGYPLVLLEAAQRSVPFIASRVGSIPEIYGDCPGAILIEPRSTDSLAAAMNNALGAAPDRYQSFRNGVFRKFQRIGSGDVIRGSLSSLLQVLAT